MYNPGDWVNVTTCKCGYQGPGKLNSIAFGNTWLVEVEREGKKSLICVREGGFQPGSRISKEPTSDLDRKHFEDEAAYAEALRKQRKSRKHRK